MENKLDNLLQEIRELKATVASMDDIVKINDRLETVEKTQQAHSITQTDVQSRLERLEKKGQQDGEQLRRPRPLGRRDADGNQAEYNQTGRSLLISPAEASVDGVKNPH